MQRTRFDFDVVSGPVPPRPEPCPPVKPSAKPASEPDQAATLSQAVAIPTNSRHKAS